MEEDDDCGLGCIGSMFDTASSRHMIQIHLPRPAGPSIEIQLRCIDGEPGHVQSGQYIWPAAEALSRYLCENWDALQSSCVVELGAGCGMAGITAAKLGGEGTSVVFTDHDLGAVRLLEENAELNGVRSRSAAVQMEWGADLPPEMSKLLPAASSSSSSSLPVLVVGSDLLYCAAVVRPLMRTVKDILVDRKGSSSGVGRFILVSSFDTGDDVEVEMVAAASECGFEISEICKLDTTRSICRIQIVTVPLNGGSAEKVGFTIDKDIFAVRYSHMDFFSRRNFSVVPKFWRAALHILDSSQLPTCIRGDGVFGLSDLLHIHESGLSEYVSEDTKYKRHTFALRVGYVGTAYTGFQDQKGHNVRTVEGDLKAALGENFPCAGRTDKDVSALSQVISFHTFDPDVTACSIVSKFRSTSVHKEGNICLLECYRVPRAFNALFTATWRRYVYMFPLNVQQERQSVCAPVDAAESGDKRSSGTNFGWFPIIADSKSYYVDVDVTVVDTLLRELEGKELPYDAYAYREKKGGGAEICMMHKARASVVDVSRWLSDDTSVPHLFLAIELVGTRFLRKMVRILAATAIRGALVAGIEASRSLLVDIALSGDRLQASAPLPGEALCMCGVGYDLQSNSKEANAANRGGAAPPTKGEANPKGIRSQRKDRKKRRRHDITEEDSEERNSAPGIHHIKTLACDT